MVLIRGKTPEINMEAKGRRQTLSNKQTDCNKWRGPGFELRRGREKKKAQQFSYYCKNSPSEATVACEA